MKMSIGWHKECLKNSSRSHKVNFDESLRCLSNSLLGMFDDEFKLLQINSAASQGKDSFDDERFMKKECEMRKKELMLVIDGKIDLIRKYCISFIEKRKV